MRASTGQHWIALDHVRALAAFLVFTWHFTHGHNGQPVPFEGAPAVFPLALLDEGHVGVSLFMALSGYLFAKLLDGKRIDYGAFFLNRLLRLAPLLVLVLVAADIVRAHNGEGTAIWPYVREFFAGFVDLSKPLPNGIWSIVVEVHFYLLLPLLMAAIRRDRHATLWFLAIAILLRTALHFYGGPVQFVAYWTIFGRVDQFLLGIFAFQFRDLIGGRHVTAASVGIALSLAYYLFDLAGGFYGSERQAWGSALWVIWPTIEGACFAALIAYYDTSFAPRATGLSWLLAKAGEYSYSIYLLHFFFVFQLAPFIHRHVMDISNFYVACLWSALIFLAMVPMGWLSFVVIEKPFLKLRRRYVRPAETAVADEPKPA